MFLAIINDTYTVVKEEIQFQQNDFEIGDYVKRGVNNVMGKVGNRVTRTFLNRVTRTFLET
jgi:hypothetical protein